ncbi:hypothetical protein EZY14_002740 [Kordia sp. TARA_039_SRF]|nr:hypothetical protein EZY14_002740 [Kordia sp. TARA_039_SRF]
MKKLVTIAAVLVCVLFFTVGCEPTALNEEDNIQLVDKKDVVRPGDQGTTNDTSTAETDTDTEEGN